MSLLKDKLNKESSYQKQSFFESWLLAAISSAFLVLLYSCTQPTENTQKSASVASSNQSTASGQSNSCQHTIKAEVVALEQIVTFNRFGAFNPAGMVYALRNDVVYDDPSTKNKVETKPLSEASNLDDPEFALSIAGKVSLRSGKRPRPLVLRVNEGECLQVKFWNLLSPLPTIHTRFDRADFPQGGVQRHSVQETPPDEPALGKMSPDDPSKHAIYDLSTPPRQTSTPGHPIFPFPRQEEPDHPTTRAASMHVNGLDYIPIKPEICKHLTDVKDADKNKITKDACANSANNLMGSDGANVGNNPSSLVDPGKSTTYIWRAKQEGGYFMYSAGALAGGEGDGGQLGLGLFGSVNVEPKGSIWYRSQVTHKELVDAGGSDNDYSNIAYENLAILDGDKIKHSDLNAIIYQTKKDEHDHNGNLGETAHVCSKRSPGSSCGMSFREFTTIFHDENKVFQAFAELSDEHNPISAIGDGMAINYGASGVGSAVLAVAKHIGPGRDCPECKLEEFFLSSWVNGDPAMIVRRDMDGRAVEALYPDDPSNVHHSYLGDPVRFRNIHAGPKETHVFHLHAHQWLQDKNDPNANYLDSQTISPGSSYTYDIQYGGGGNRNLTVGDAIFHCHLYPHFAAGMWELWRNHDVFEDGKPGLFDAKTNPRGRNLPDKEIAGGTPNPAIVPIPDYPLAPIPTADLPGYPFFIAGEAGHRPPQPPLDMAFKDPKKPEAGWLDGGLPRHIITKGENEKIELDKKEVVDKLLEGFGDKSATKASRYVAKRTWQLNNDPNTLALAKKVESAQLKILPQCGTEREILAMAYHAGWSQQTILAIKTNKKPADINAGVWQACRNDFQAAFTKFSNDNKWPLEPVSTLWPYKRHIHNDTNPNPQSSTAVMSALWQGMGYQQFKAGKPIKASHPKGDDKQPSTEVDPGTRFRVNGYAPAQGAPFADPCPKQYFEEKINNNRPFPVNRDTPRIYKSAYIQFDMTTNKYGWHDPQARMPVLEEDVAATLKGERLAEPLFFRANSGDCIQFQATNLIPSVLNLDDFQVYTPTDTIGQHIHLVKFDVTSSDGSANGWNYEDGTFSPDEVRERIAASRFVYPANDKKSNDKKPTNGKLIGWDNKEITEENFKDYHLTSAQLTPKTYILKGTNPKLGSCSEHEQENNEQHPWCGAQTTVQRWWADPVLNHLWEDRSMRAVFTHDHYGPSSHQQHGFYAALVVEPKNSVWTQLGGNPEKVADRISGEIKLKCAQSAPKLAGAIGDRAYGGGENGKPLKCREDGGPTSYAANIGYANSKDNQDKKSDVRREYNLAFADFAILYNADLRPVNPPSRQTELPLPHNVRDGLKPKPEGISTEDPGTRLLNYRNEPIPLRIAEEDKGSLEYHQKLDKSTGLTSNEGDMANVFSSVIHDKTAKNLPNGSERIKKLAQNVPYEIIDTALLTSLLDYQKKKTNEFKILIGKNEPWRHPGDPSTPVIAAYEGDLMQLHLIQGAQEEQHVFSINGMDWLAEPKSPNSSFINGQQLGISEHFEFDTTISDGPAIQTDYWLGSPSVENMWDGMWGLLRGYGNIEDNEIELNKKLAKLPNAAVKPPALILRQADKATCPMASVDPTKSKEKPETPLVTHYVTAWQASEISELVFNKRFQITDPNAAVFFEIPKQLAVDPNDVNSKFRHGEKIKKYLIENKSTIEPMVLRANAGDCVDIEFMNYLPVNLAQNTGNTAKQKAALDYSYNLMPPIVNGFNFNQVQMSNSVGLVPQLVAENVFNSVGSNVGFNRWDQFECLTSEAEKCKEVLNDYLQQMPKGCLAPDKPNPFENCNSTDNDAYQASYRWYMGKRKVITQQYAEGNPCHADTGDCFDELIDTNKGASEGYIRYAPIEFGAVAIRSFGDVIKHSSHSLVGTLVVEPKDAYYVKGGKDCEISNKSPTFDVSTDTRICIPKKGDEIAHEFREFVLIIQDDLSLQQHGQPMPNHRMADDAEDTGQKGFNFRTEPLWARNGVGTSGADFNTLNSVDYTNTLSSIYPNLGCNGSCKSPETPVFSAKAGESVRFRIVHPGGHSRQHAFVLYGHNWDYQPWINNSTELYDNIDSLSEEAKLLTSRLGAIGGLGPGRHVNVLTKAGGHFGIPGDYLFRVQEQFQFQGGLWGIFRVTP